MRGRLTAEAPLAPLVWFKTGGRAEWLFEPKDVDDLRDFLAELDPAVPVMALGLGSNLIVRDGGVPGVVVRLGKAFAKVERSSATTAALRRRRERHPRLLDGARRRHRRPRIPARIPGTVGGFVRMNGGAYGREVKDILVECDVVLRAGERRDAGRGRRSATPIATASCPRARSSSARRSAGMPGEPAAIQAEMDRIAAEREASQPLRSRTGGSTFKNPPGTKAWKLIDAAGCRGLTHRRRAGLARSIATSCSTSARRRRADIEALGEEVRRRVRGDSGVDARMGNPAGGSECVMRKLHVAVLMGGWSAEREVSLITGDGVADALESRGHRVTRIDMDRDVAAAARRGAARRRLQRAARHAGRGRHGPGADGPDGPQIHP